MTNDFNKTENERFTIDCLFMITDHQNKDVLNPLMESRDTYKVFKLLNELNNENRHIKQTLDDMIETERTELGKSVLKQFKEQIK